MCRPLALRNSTPTRFWTSRPFLCKVTTRFRRKVGPGFSFLGGFVPNPFPKNLLPLQLVRREGIEPSSQAWEAHILPMNYRRDNQPLKSQTRFRLARNHK